MYTKTITVPGRSVETDDPTSTTPPDFVITYSIAVEPGVDLHTVIRALVDSTQLVIDHVHGDAANDGQCDHD